MLLVMNTARDPGQSSCYTVWPRKGLSLFPLSELSEHWVVGKKALAPHLLFILRSRKLIQLSIPPFSLRRAVLLGTTEPVVTFMPALYSLLQERCVWFDGKH